MRKSMDLILGAELKGTFVPDNHGCQGRCFATVAYFPVDRREDATREEGADPSFGECEPVSYDLNPEQRLLLIERGGVDEFAEALEEPQNEDSIALAANSAGEEPVAGDGWVLRTAPKSVLGKGNGNGKGPALHGPARVRMNARPLVHPARMKKVFTRIEKGYN